MNGGDYMQEKQYTLKQIRALAGLSQQQAADLLNIHVATYGKLEQTPGRLTLCQAFLLSEAAGIELNQIQFQD